MSNTPPRDPDSYLLSTADFNAFVVKCMDYAKKDLTTDRKFGFMPVCFLEVLIPPAERGMVIILMPDFDVDRRYEYLEAFGVKCAREGHLVMAFAMLSEAWRTTGPEPLNERPMPRDDPKRIETISAVAQTVEGRLALSFMDVTRDKKGVMSPLEIEHIPYDDARPDDRHSDLCDSFYKGYRKGLREKIVSDPLARKVINDMQKKASGRPPEAPYIKFN